MKHRSLLSKSASLAILAGLGIAMSGPAAADDASSAVVNRKIGYVVYDKHWDVYVTADKKECPNGFNDGPREIFKALFPQDKGQKWTLVEAQLAREGETWFPTMAPEPWGYKEVVGTVANGLDLDGKADANDFTSPMGEPGIDNQLYRAMGCTAAFRGPDGFHYAYLNKEMITYHYNRIAIEISDVDSLVNDDDVTVTSYHTRDGITTDANGAFMEGGTQRIDYQWGKKFISKFKGKIVDGLLTTAPADVYFPDVDIHTNVSNQLMRGGRFQLKLTANGAEGHLAGYADIDTLYTTMNRTFSTHHQSYGQLSAPSFYRAINRLADGYPDPKTGKMTAISSALQLKFVQAFLHHGQEEQRSKQIASDETPGLEENAPIN